MPQPLPQAVDAARGSASGSSRPARWSARRRSAAWARRPAPSRSSRAGACRRTAGAGSRPQPLRGLGMPTRPSTSTARLVRPAAYARGAAARVSAICLPDGHRRVQRRHRVLEDHPDLVAADLAHARVVAAPARSGPPSRIWPPAMCAAGRQQPHDRHRRSSSCRSRTRRPGRAPRRVHREAHAVDRVHGGPLQPDLGRADRRFRAPAPQVDFRPALGALWLSASRCSRTSNSVTQRVTDEVERDDDEHDQQSGRVDQPPVARRDVVGAVGEHAAPGRLRAAARPRPRKLSMARNRIASATWKVALTTIVPTAFGVMCRSTDARPAAAHHLDRLHVLAHPQAQRLAADQPGDGEPGRQRDDEDHVAGWA